MTVPAVAASESNTEQVLLHAYTDAFREYAATHAEAALYRASLLSRAFVERGLGPEEIVALHGQAFALAWEGRGDRERLRLSTDSLEFLLEVMIAYGVQHTEYLELKAREGVREAEARTARRAAEQAHRLQLLSDVALANLGLDRLLDELLSRVREILSVDTVAVLLLTEDEHLVVRAAIGLEDEIAASTHVPLGRGIAGRIGASRGPLIVHDVPNEEIFSPALRARGLQSLLGVPLLVEGKLSGVLHVGTLQSREFTDEDARLLQLVADRLALAIDRASLYERVVEHEAQLRTLVGRLLATQEEERRRVAYDVHDGLAQVAASAYQHLQVFADDFPPHAPAARKELDRALELALRTVREARRVIAGLRPAALDDLGLAAALRQELDELRADGWQVAYVEDLGHERLGPVLDTALFRAAQEALANVRKHAAATRVHVALHRTGRNVHLEVRDWGVGFVAPSPGTDAAGPGERIGLAGMRERIELVGGTCTVRSRAGEGTQIFIDVPLPEDRAR